MENKNLIDKLYFVPSKDKNIPKHKNSNFKLKEKNKEEEYKTNSITIVPSNLNKNIILGSVIIQNWETKKNINKKK